VIGDAQRLALLAAMLRGTKGTAQAFVPGSAGPLAIDAIRLALGGAVDGAGFCRDSAVVRRVGPSIEGPEAHLTENRWKVMKSLQQIGLSPRRG